MISNLLSAVLIIASVTAGSAEHPNAFGPSLDSARNNGPQIFNAIHNAMRQFGSSFHHNGMSLFPAVVPEGVLLYHGTYTREVPAAYEWLAFELEHAEAFAYVLGPARKSPKPQSSGRDDGNGQSRLGRQREEEDPLSIAFVADGHPRPPVGSPGEPPTGYLHIYQATRPLNVLYVDGMAAAKTDMGTLDTQDFLLAGLRDRSPWDEFRRAESLCDLAKEWGIDGILRMEAGFEIIYCDFTDGLRLVSAHQQPGADDAGLIQDQMLMIGEWVRAAAQQYKDIGSSRVLLDYSSIVSAFFYPINFTNPDPDRPVLPRLSQASDEELDVLRLDAADTVRRSTSRSQAAAADWQGVTDMVISRYVGHLPLMAGARSLDILKREVNCLVNVYIDYAVADAGFLAARSRCSGFFLRSVTVRTPKDRLVRAALESTTAMICEALFRVRQLVVEDPDADERAVIAANEVVRDLMDALAWSEWRECGRCEPNEVCFIAMWPWGSVEDHFNPGCVDIAAVAARNSYWPRPLPQRREDVKTEELR
ncbi:hypothetical protein F4779DRAFT_578478 [Xylariaceae sp. FL0662B]|nr:hypothetical protein F4779DRAFT_578478 [Xylariaceae sp. FL0662B]